MQKRLEVGDRVVMRDVNEHRMGGVREGTVTKVARKLFYVIPDGGWKEYCYKIEDRQANDKWGHAWIQTPKEYEDAKLRSELIKQLREKGIEVRPGFSKKINLEQIQRLLGVFDE